MRSLRVMVISNVLPPAGKGGAERNAADLASGLSSRHEVLVVSGTTPDPAWDFRSTKITHLPFLTHDASLGRKALWHLRDQWSLAVHRRLLGILREFRPDVVHSHEPQGLSAAVFTAVRRYGCAHVHTAHDLNILCLRTTQTKSGRFCGGGCIECAPQRTLRSAAFTNSVGLLLTPSDYIRERYVAHRLVRRDQALKIRYGVTPGPVIVRPAHSRPVQLGYLGNLSEHKGVRTLLDWFASYKRSDTQLHIGGAGELESLVRARAAADPRIVFHGYVLEATKERFFGSVDVLIIPSEWEETAPIVSTEAAIRGIPAVVSNRGGLPETPSAWIFKAGNMADLDRAISQASNPRLLAARSQELLAITDDLTLEKHISRVEQALYAAVVTRENSPA